MAEVTKPVVVLFDVDETLVHTGGSGARSWKAAFPGVGHLPWVTTEAKLTANHRECASGSYDPKSLDVPLGEACEIRRQSSDSADVPQIWLQPPDFAPILQSSANMSWFGVLSSNISCDITQI